MITFKRRILLTSALYVCLAVCLVAVSGFAGDEEQEKAAIEKAGSLIKDGKHVEAARVLIQAAELHPESLKIAELKVTAFEEAGATRDYIIEAYSALITLLKKKGADELEKDEKELLERSEKKYGEMTEYRGQVDGCLAKFRAEAEKAFIKLIKKKKYLEAAFVYRRLADAGSDNARLEAAAEKFGEYDYKVFVVPEPYRDDSLEMQKMLEAALKEVRRKKLESAISTCEKALEENPSSPLARSVLFSAACAAKKRDDIVKNALAYLLTPPYFHDLKRIKMMEKRTVKECPELKKFYEISEDAVKELAKIARETRSSRRDDFLYAVERLFRITHRSKNAESLVSDPLAPKGTKILPGKKFSEKHWMGVSAARAELGNIIFTKYDEGACLAMFQAMEMQDSFELSYTFSPGASISKKRGAETVWPAVGAIFFRSIQRARVVLLIGGSGGEGSFTLLRFCDTRERAESQMKGRYSGPRLTPGDLYRLNVSYNHAERRLKVFIDGKQATDITFREDIRFDSKGMLCVSSQMYDSLKVTDIYLSP
ncbi:MAG: hypothetical protein ACYS8W_13580 [Planctomycetota bacterium]|jgi:tetratricopeptide (TPR) repeat protein